jgi:RNA polymerase sigma-70 factor (ECF subfamily)
LLIARALADLPTSQREAIVLVDVEGYSVEEAAEMLDCPAGTVKSRCSRGRARLAEALGFLRDDRDSSVNTPGDERNHHPPPSVGRSGTTDDNGREGR